MPEQSLKDKSVKGVGWSVVDNVVPNAIAIVPLIEGLVVKEDILGYVTERIQLTSSVEMEICFPVLTQNSSIFDERLGCPYKNVDLTCGEIYWGGCYHSNANGEILDYRISSILVKIYGKIETAGLKIKPLANRAVQNFLKILEFVNPYALCENLATGNRGNSDLFPISTTLQNGRFHECGQCVSSDIEAIRAFTMKDIEYAINNINEEISLPYQMLHTARRCLISRDYRDCILNCATSIEMPFLQAIIKYFDANLVPRKIQEAIISQFNGINQKYEMCKKLNIPLKYKDKYKKVMKLRNRVIHGGFTPQYAEVKSLYDITYSFLKEQNIGMFG